MPTKTLILLSGGQDSTTCLFLAKTAGTEVHAVTFDYGQLHRAELLAAEQIAHRAQVTSHEVIRVPLLHSTSALVNPNTALQRYASFAAMQHLIGNDIEATFIPLRNPLLLVIAANRAVALGCQEILFGACQEDCANFPDCTPAFLAAFEHALSLALAAPLRLSAPLSALSKADTVRLAASLPGCMEALAFSHTSYDGAYPPTDPNHANLLRAQGFLQAGLPDPLVLRAWQEGLMTLPETANYETLRNNDRCARP